MMASFTQAGWLKAVDVVAEQGRGALWRRHEDGVRRDVLEVNHSGVLDALLGIREVSIDEIARGSPGADEIADHRAFSLCRNTSPTNTRCNPRRGYPIRCVPFGRLFFSRRCRPPVDPSRRL